MTRLQVLTSSFKAALVLTVSSVLKIPTSAVTKVSISFNTTDVRHRRMLQSSATVTYDINLNSSSSSEDLVTALQSSISDGSFISTLSTDSGIFSIGITGLVIENDSPTRAPTSSPLQSSTHSGNKLKLII